MQTKHTFNHGLHPNFTVLLGAPASRLGDQVLGISFSAT